MTAEGFSSVQPEYGTVASITTAIKTAQEALPHTTVTDATLHTGAAIELLTLSGSQSASPDLAAARVQLLTAKELALAATEQLQGVHENLAGYVGVLTTGESVTARPETPAMPLQTPTSIGRQRRQHRRPLTDRQKFQRTHGFALYTDLNDRLMEELHDTFIPPLAANALAIYKDEIRWNSHREEQIIRNPAGCALYMAMSQIIRQLPGRETFIRTFGMNASDLHEAAHFTHLHGLADIEFPWSFGAFTANAVADFFVGEGVITQEQKNNFTLKDWANMIGSGWFSRLVHLLAIAPNGAYGRNGSDIWHYDTNYLHKELVTLSVNSDLGPIFEYKAQTESDEGITYDTAVLSREAIMTLRAALARNGNSLGCPVARYSVALDENMVRDPHVQNLIDRGTLTIVPERSDNGTVRLTQDWSAIDKTLSLFAAQLDIYQTVYGNPVIVLDEKSWKTAVATAPPPPRIRHTSAEPQNLLRRPAVPLAQGTL